MAITWFDQKLFVLPCKHSVVLSRLVRVDTTFSPKVDTWTCEEGGCGKVTDLRIEPYRSALEKEWDEADQLDKQARERGENVVRFDPNEKS